MHALTTTQPTTLSMVMDLTDEALFAAPMLARALALLEAEAGPLVADVDTDDGRKEINRLARAVGGAIKRLDERRAAFVAELKRRPAEIDRQFRETFRTPAEALKERIRKPLDDWAEALRQADEETARLLADLNAPIEAGTSVRAIAERLDATMNLDLPDWLSETQRAAVTAAMQQAIPRLEAAHAAAFQAAAQAAELERLRQVEREMELLRAREQAAAQARADAEAAAAAERERLAAAQAMEQAALAQRTADRAHRAAIHREALADLCALGLTDDLGRAVVAAIANGKVRHVHLAY